MRSRVWSSARRQPPLLIDAGYVQIGIDHFARPNDPLSCASAEGGGFTAISRATPPTRRRP